MLEITLRTFLTTSKLRSQVGSWWYSLMIKESETAEKRHEFSALAFAEGVGEVGADPSCLTGRAEKLAQFEVNIQVYIRSDRQVASSKAKTVFTRGL